MAAEQQNECNGKGSVENEACQGVLAEQKLAKLMVSCCIDHMQNHSCQNHEHTKCNRCDKYGVHRTDERKRCHRFLRMQPEGRYDILKSEEAAEQESEDHREYRAGTHDRCQIHLLVVVQQCAANQQTQSLSYIGKHDSENKGIGESYDNRRVNFIVIWQSVHLHVHLKRTEDFRVFQLCRRLTQNVVCIILDKAEEICVVFDVLLEGSGIFFRHPAAQNIESFLLGFCAGCQATDIKVAGELL